VNRFPRGLRPSTIAERRQFYLKEFDTASVDRWIGKRKKQLKFAMIPGRHTGLVVESHSRDKDNVVIVDDYENARDLQAYALEYLPESMYYDRNRYVDVRDCAKCGDYPDRCQRCYNRTGQQLAFDLDPENVDCPFHGHIGEKMQRGTGLSFCMYEFNVVKRQTSKLQEELCSQFDLVSVVYSGRGFHVVVDDEPAYSLTRKQRTEMAKRLSRRYAIDEWVTEGGSRLLRLPHSLNGLVSRKCVIIKDAKDLRGFDPRYSREVVPDFARSA